LSAAISASGLITPVEVSLWMSVRASNWPVASLASICSARMGEPHSTLRPSACLPQRVETSSHLSENALASFIAGARRHRLLAGLAGSLVSMTETVTPFGGFPYTISAFVVIILGGLGNLGGGVLGAVLLAVIEIYGVALSSAAYRSILLYGVFIAILLFRPQGLLGRSTR